MAENGQFPQNASDMSKAVLRRTPSGFLNVLPDVGQMISYFFMFPDGVRFEHHRRAIVGSNYHSRRPLQGARSLPGRIRLSYSVQNSL